jgi:hypothetical protein
MGFPAALFLVLSARTLALQHRVPKSELWKGFSGAPTAAKAAVGYLALLLGACSGPGGNHPPQIAAFPLEV